MAVKVKVEARVARFAGFVFAADIESALTFREAHLLARLGRGKNVLEIGSQYGRSTIALASVARSLVAVDPHDLGPLGAEDTLGPLRANLDRYGLLDRVDIRKGYAHEVLPTITRRFDLVFLDADHRREEVKRDLAMLLPFVQAPGVLAFHDYGKSGTMFRGQWDAWGVTEVVDEFAAERGLRVTTAGTLAVVHLP